MEPDLHGGVARCLRQRNLDVPAEQVGAVLRPDRGPGRPAVEADVDVGGRLQAEVPRVEGDRRRGDVRQVGDRRGEVGVLGAGVAVLEAVDGREAAGAAGEVAPVRRVVEDPAGRGSGAVVRHGPAGGRRVGVERLGEAVLVQGVAGRGAAGRVDRDGDVLLEVGGAGRRPSSSTPDTRSRRAWSRACRSR